MEALSRKKRRNKIRCSSGCNPPRLPMHADTQAHGRNRTLSVLGQESQGIVVLLSRWSGSNDRRSATSLHPPGQTNAFLYICRVLLAVPSGYVCTCPFLHILPMQSFRLSTPQFRRCSPFHGLPRAGHASGMCSADGATTEPRGRRREQCGLIDWMTEENR